MVKAFGTKATIESLVPHLQLCPLSADRAVAESGVCCLADRIIHMHGLSVHLNPELSPGSLRQTSYAIVCIVLFDAFAGLKFPNLLGPRLPDDRPTIRSVLDRTLDWLFHK